METPDRWTGITALTDPSRRALFDYVRRAGHPVSRDEAGDGTGMSRGLAAFHLDKLVEVGLLRARYEAPPGRPRGRGRSPKVYEPVGDGIAVTVPERRYELIAEILADAVAEDPTDAGRAAGRHAHRYGARLGTALATDGHDLGGALTRLGFEPGPGAGPASGTGRVVLRNCPFHALTARHAALVCVLNHAFLTGLLDGLATTGHRAVLAPRPGHCCVELTPRD